MSTVRPTGTAVPYQKADLNAYGVTVERAGHEVIWVDADARVTGGVQAFAKLLRRSGRVWYPLGLALSVPPIRWAALVVYRLIARNRHRMPGGTAACALS